MYSTINRLNFASATDIPNYPDFLEIQVKSFGDFFNLRQNLMKEPMKVFLTLLKKTFLFQILEINLY